MNDLIYAGIKRWHFHAGVFVLPFLFLLSLSGLLMLITKPIEPLFHQDLITVQAQENSLPDSALLNMVEKKYAHAVVKLYIPPTHAEESARFSVVAGEHAGHGGHDQPSEVVYVNPFSGDILGSLDPTQSVYTLIKDFHGSLFLGDVGDGLIEVASGLSILLILTGLFMAWPKARWRTLKSKEGTNSRGGWLRLHRIVGLIVALPLLLFLLSGLTWTNFWGGKLVQPWGSLPGTSFTAPKAEHKFTHNHESMNQHGVHQVPWTMEQTPMPQSSSKFDGQLDLDTAITIAQQQGFDDFRVHLPQSDRAVWTISATTMSGDITNPLKERTIHLDRFSGEILADLPFADYPKLGKAMATFVPLHQGDLGWWNWLLNIIIVSMTTVLLYTGMLMWWKRRPKHQTRLAPPVAQPRANKMVVITMLLISLCFPLSALALVAIIIIDWLVLSRFKLLQKWFK